MLVLISAISLAACTFYLARNAIFAGERIPGPRRLPLLGLAKLTRYGNRPSQYLQETPFSCQKDISGHGLSGCTMNSVSVGLPLPGLS